MIREALVRVFDRVRERFLVGLATQEHVERLYDNFASWSVSAAAG